MWMGPQIHHPTKYFYSSTKCMAVTSSRGASENWSCEEAQTAQ